MNNNSNNISSLLSRRFYDINTFFKNKFKTKVYKIPLDAGFTCPNIDGTKGKGGCIYCNNKSFSPPLFKGVKKDIEAQIKEGIEKGRKYYKAKKFIAYFQTYSNTHGDIEFLKNQYFKVLKFEDIIGLAIGTRPDCIDKKKIELLENIAKNKYVSIEYGLQSINNDTLNWINRQHTFEDFLNAVEITKNRGINICVHIMIGFPNENRGQILKTAEILNKLQINSVKLHNLLIIKDTKLAKIYEKEKFKLLDYNEYISIVSDFLEILSPKIVIERVCAIALSDTLIAPIWKKSSSQIMNDITKELEKRGTYQGSKYKYEKQNLF